MIPIEYGRKILAEPQKRDGKYKDIEVAFMDHNRQIWPMEAYFSERRSSYMLGLNWDRYVKKFKLEPQDMIFFYHDPAIPTHNHYLMKFEKKGGDSNPTKKPSDPMEIPRRSLEIPRRCPAFPRRSPAFPRRSPPFPRRSLAIPRRSLAMRSLAIPRRSLAIPRRSLVIPRTPLEKSFWWANAFRI